MTLPGLKKNTPYALRIAGWAGLTISVAALGVIVGRELRIRYKFNRRTPVDFYNHAGDQTMPEYGVGT